VPDDRSELVVAVGHQVGFDADGLAHDALDGVGAGVDGRLEVTDDHSAAAVGGEVDRRHRGVKGGEVGDPS
jgi:hypothetical protein